MPYLREGYKSANNPDEDDVEGHGGHGRNRAVPTEDDDTEGHDFRSPASRGE
jgi:hypothetical protein